LILLKKWSFENKEFKNWNKEILRLIIPITLYYDICGLHYTIAEKTSLFSVNKEQYWMKE
jgi:hypothetical protein